jgi:hypothetical protein
MAGPQALIGLLRELGDQAEAARKKKGKPVMVPGSGGVNTLSP